MADDVLTRNGDGELAVRTVQSTGDNYVNPNDVYTRDNDGKLCVRTVGNGGGGGGAVDSVNGKTGVVVLDAEDVGAIPQYTTMPTASASNVGEVAQFVGATDTYTNGYFYKCVSDGQQPATYSWTQTDVQPAPVIPNPLPSQTNKEGMFLQTNGSTAQWSDTRLTHSTTKTFTYDENTMENVLRITPKQNRDCWVRIECWEGNSDGEGGVTEGQQLFASDLYLSHADLSREDSNYSSKALITGLNYGNYISFSPCVQVFYDEGGQTVGGFFDIDTFYTNEEEIPTGEERYVIMDIKYSDGVDAFTYPETFEGNPLDYSTGMLLPNPTSIKSGYGNVNCIPMAEYGGQDVQWFRYPFGNVFVNPPFDDNAKTLVTQGGDFALTWASQVRELPTFDNADEYTVLLDPVAIFQYTGETTNDYTQGYFYKIQYDLDRNAVATQTAGSSLTDITVNQAVFADWIKQEWGYFQGTYEFTFDGSNWSGTQGGEYADLTDMGITYTGTPVANDVIEVTFDEATWTWVQVNVQPAPDPLPSQTGQSGKFLTTDGTDASWSNKPVINSASNVGQNLAINCYDNNNTLGSIGISSEWNIGSIEGTAGSVNIGGGSVSANYAIQLGGTNQFTHNNPDANTFKVANENGNFEIMDANGNLPADRLASTTGLADGNYRLRLTMSNGVPTLTWVAE